MKKRKKLKNKIIIYAIVIVGIVLLALLLFHSALRHYNSFKENQKYFKENNSPKIESWMTPRTILRHFNISEDNLFKELNVTKTDSNLRTPLSKICKKNKIDCNLVIKKLNNVVE